MALSDWDFARVACFPNFIPYLIGGSPILSAASTSNRKTSHFEILSVHDLLQHLASAGEITRQE